MSVTKRGIVTRSLTLRRLFDLDASMTAEESGPWSLFQKKLHEETNGVRWPAAMPDLLAEVAELFEIPISDIFIASWKNADALKSEIEASRKALEETSFLSLSEHTITSEFHPTIDVRIPGKEIKSLQFTTRLSLTLEGFTLRVSNGRITHINAGRYGGKGSIHYGDLCLAVKEFKQQALPLAIPIERRKFE